MDNNAEQRLAKLEQRLEQLERAVRDLREPLSRFLATAEKQQKALLDLLAAARPYTD